MSSPDPSSGWHRDAVDACVSTAVLLTIFLLIVS
jgi:hypothetical protein